MSDLRFNCASCGQHLSGDERYAGLEITCPSCGKTVVVPGAPAAVRLSGAAPVPPVPAAGPRQAPPPTQKTSGLAIASLICSIGSFIIIPFGFVPGIICGHMARKRIAATPGVRGGGLAKAGLIIGYVGLVLTVLVVAAFVAFFALFAARVKQMSPPPRSQRSVMLTHPRSAAPAEPETSDTEPDGSGWTMKLAGVETPAGAVTGRIHGQPFKLQKVTLEAGWLNFMEGRDLIADREMDVVIFENDPTKLSGRTFIVPKEEFGNKPHIWMKWKEGGEKSLKQRNFVDRYALRLEFGQFSGGKLPGKIYLCVSDQEKSFVAGTFQLRVQGNR